MLAASTVLPYLFSVPLFSLKARIIWVVALAAAPPHTCWMLSSLVGGETRTSPSNWRRPEL
jgi:hypothetical protein